MNIDILLDFQVKNQLADLAANKIMINIQRKERNWFSKQKKSSNYLIRNHKKRRLQFNLKLKNLKKMKKRKMSLKDNFV